jgi:uncharacterized protein YhhL (DUF1145 family)
MAALPELIHDVVSKTALLIHGGKAILLNGSFATTRDARVAAEKQFPALFGIVELVPPPASPGASRE